MQKYGTGQVIGTEGQEGLERVAQAARQPLTDKDVRVIEAEDEKEE